MAASTSSTVVPSFLGTWKTVSIQTSHAEIPHPESMISTYSSKDDGFEYTTEAAWSDGRKTRSHAFFRFDGGWYPATGSVLFDSLSARQLDDRSVEGRFKQGGQEIGSQRAVFSEDGQTSTAEWSLVGPGGATITWKVVLNRG